MPSGLNRTHEKFWLWVDSQLVIARLNRTRTSAVFAEHAQIGSEALIENLSKDPKRITIDKNSYVRGRLLVYKHAGQIAIGEWSYIGVRTEIWSMHSINIGNRVLIAHDVNIHDGTAHSLDKDERHEHFRRIVTSGHPHNSALLPGVTSAPIVIEDDVWISFGVTILKGVRIGAGSVIAAGATVVHDVPPNMLYRNEVRPVITPLV